MAAKNLPEILLTDPNNHDSAPSPAQSPIRGANGASLPLRNGRSTTPPRSSASDRMNSFSTPNGRSDSADTRSPSQTQHSPPNDVQPKDGYVNGEAQAAMDPLSQHILNRTNSTNIVPPARRSTTPDGPKDSTENRVAPAVQSPGPRQEPNSEEAKKDLKKGIKAVSFLSRLVGNKKRETNEDTVDDSSSLSDNRPEGNNAEIFSQPIDSMGFNPQHAAPPAYIKVRSKNKTKRDFDRLFLAQQLDCRKVKQLKRTESNKLRRKTSMNTDNPDTIWAMEFSRDGKYLAAAGAGMTVRVWAVLSSSDERQQHEKQEAAESGGFEARTEHLSAPVFQTNPVREYEGHTATVLDLSWSKNNFLLSSSMDKTVRLWHISRSECLCTFKHSDFVPSIDFHPKDDRFFLAGSLDSKLRLWSIPDKNVAFSASLPDLITAVAFTPDGKYAMAGCLNGLCTFYETEGLKYATQIHVRSTRGQNAKGSKITGIHAHHSHSGDLKLLITSNDSRIRLYNFRDKSLELKLKGNENNCSQIRAKLSDDGRYVVCGSEDRKAYIWSLHPAEGDKRDKPPVEMFEAHNTIATVVCLAPAKTRQLLSKSEDPIYDLCNPPPIMLMSRAEQDGSVASSKHASETGSIQATPADKEGVFKRPEQSPAYLQRSGHKEGNIVVTADYSGKIKVFRQDCAWAKRKPDESDRGSMFSKRGTRSSRQNSVVTKASQPSLRGEPRSSISTQSDRIMSWRQGISSNPDSKGSSRSISPRKSLSQASRDGANPRSTGRASDGNLPLNTPRSQAQAAQSTSAPAQRRTSLTIEESIELHRAENPMVIKGGKSYMFWDPVQWRERAQQYREHHIEHSPERLERINTSEPAEGVDPMHLAVRPAVSSQPSYVSQLSDERSTEEEETTGDEFDDAREGQDEEMKCRVCGGTSFSVRKMKDGTTALACAKCGERA